MRLNFVLDSVYVLGSLWGALTGAKVCPVNPEAIPRTAREAAWSPELGDGPPGGRVAVTAFVDVTVIPMDQERVLPNQTVLVEGGKIIALGPASRVKIPAGAVWIDGRSKYLIPGLTDMHHHLWGITAGGTPGVPTERITQDSLFRALALGVTALRFLDDQEHFDRQQWLDAWRKRPEVPTPHIYFGPRMPKSIRSDSVAAVIAAAKAAGYDFIRIPGAGGTPQFSPEERVAFDSLLAAARRVGLPVAVHDMSLRFEEVLALGTAGGSLEHAPEAFNDIFGWRKAGIGPLPEVSQATLQQTVAALQRAGVWITPTLQCDTPDGSASAPGFSKILHQFVKAMQDAGGKLLLSADDGWTVHDELAALVRAGLTPYQALRTGTYNPAAYFGKLDEVGTVAVGKRADLVLLAGNPLEDIRHTREPTGVMRAGRWLDRVELDRRLLAWKSSGLHTNDPARPAPHSWLIAALNNHGIAGHRAKGSLPPRLHKLAALVDSLAAVPPAGKHAHEPLMRRLAEELGALRATLTPVQQERFDAVARVWLREHHRHGYQVAVPGVVLRS